MQDTQHQEHYREQSFWDKLKRYAKKAGREVIETVLDSFTTVRKTAIRHVGRKPQY